MKNKAINEFIRLLEIMDTLRAECPWDRKQTNESLRKLTIEEVYELAEAIDQNNFEHIKNELGDILLHMVFYAKIAEEQNQFDISDVLFAINKKLIERHPHVFSNVEVADDEEVKRNWEEIKLKNGEKRVLNGVPKSLPAMIKAYRIQEKVRGVGFDWDVRSQVWDKVKEELSELQFSADKNLGIDELENEFGDVLFSIINAARLYNIDPEKALEKTNQKFIRRFNYLEEQTIMKGKSLHNMTLDEMNQIWEEAKKFDL